MIGSDRRLVAVLRDLVWIGTVVVTFWIVLGSWVAVFPDTIEKVVGVDYGPFKDAWGVSRLRFETYTLGTLAIVVLVGALGCFAGRPIRREVAAVPVAEPAPT